MKSTPAEARTLSLIACLLGIAFREFAFQSVPICDVGALCFNKLGEQRLGLSGVVAFVG
jgi:hypothetical protein